MRKNVFVNVVRPAPAAEPAEPAVPAGEGARPPKTPGSYPKHRQGKKALIGYYSPAVSKALLQLALDEDTTLQALIGEAIDLLMRDRGKHPFGER